MSIFAINYNNLNIEDFGYMNMSIVLAYLFEMPMFPSI